MNARVSAAEPGLADALKLPLDPHAYFVLEHAHGRLQLRDTRQGAPGPLCVDFDSVDAERRRDAGRQLPLARAVGVKGDARPRVLDATAGLGRDAYTLAALGCEVTAVERSPLIAALLRDGLERAACELRLVVGDACDYMAGLDESERPDVVYLDPMFPERRKSAAVKKEMRYMQELLGPDDADALFAAALKCAKQRVVVKRPAHAPQLAKPNHTLEGKTVRFDVYVV
ncbi:MAG: Ribosomal RNA small subunit methyltransferase J [Planctomycetes bacterium]|nr:Ribosomal RNA small subunit methyltransferase J [Planctomycetota bacterium]